MMSPDPMISSTPSLDTHESSSNDNPKAKKQKLLILEPAVFLLFFAWNLSSAVFTNQVVYQSCTAALGFNQTECKYLGSSNESKEIKVSDCFMIFFKKNLTNFHNVIDSRILNSWYNLMLLTL
jgi:hypothetical protein